MKYVYFCLFLNILVAKAQVPFTTTGIPSGSFGVSYAINGNDIFAGVTTNMGFVNPSPGTVHFFSKQTGVILQQQVIESPTGSLADSFGGGLSAQGDFVAIAATAYQSAGESGIGKAYIYKKNAESYSLFHTISAPDESAGDAFGIPYFFGADLFVSSKFDETDGLAVDTNSGSVYRFHFNGTDWDFAQKIEVSGTVNFGNEIRAEGDRLVISSLTGGFSKDLHTFNRIGNDWIFQGTTSLSLEETSEFYGYHGFDLSEGKLYILRDIPSDSPGLNTEIVVMELSLGIWEESSSFGIDTGDEFFS